ncbi:MAG: M18 family aminopeptidase [Muribaculaceae bacterium]|nr:M18 family aminopeptidase [Muribaculaceae bacterium]
MYTPTPLVADLMKFLDGSPVNFIAVEQCIARLTDAGFTPLDPADEWTLRPGGRYYITKNDSAIVAFVIADSPAPAIPFSIISAHSDSPGFRIKPHSAMFTEGGIVKLNTEVYGGPILYTWFDRPLSIAGRVMLKGTDALHPVSRKIMVKRPLLTIPHLAIHFNRAVNDGNPLSRQKDMLPIIGYVNSQLEADNLLLNLIAEELHVPAADIIDFDLSLYDTTPVCLLGLNNEFITSGRIDDLSMVHAAITSLIAEASVPSHRTRIAAIFDNEETGSGTKQGAASPMLMHLMRRICFSLGGDEQSYLRSIAESFMISADNAHGLHPNYPEKQDPTNHPQLGRGPVIKYNANCKYMTDAESASVYMSICNDAGVQYQTFVNHSDVAGGSTLGNILTSQIDLRGVDMGAAIWAMHSVRETASAADHDSIARTFRRFYTL